MGHMFGATTQTKKYLLITSWAMKKQGSGYHHQLHPVRPHTDTSAHLPPSSLPQPIPTSHRVHSGLQATSAAIVKFSEFPVPFHMDSNKTCQNDFSLINPLSCWQSGEYSEETAWIDNVSAALSLPQGTPSIIPRSRTQHWSHLVGMVLLDKNSVRVFHPLLTLGFPWHQHSCWQRVTLVRAWLRACGCWRVRG